MLQFIASSAVNAIFQPNIRAFENALDTGNQAEINRLLKKRDNPTAKTQYDFPDVVAHISKNMESLNDRLNTAITQNTFTADKLDCFLLTPGLAEYNAAHGNTAVIKAIQHNKLQLVKKLIKFAAILDGINANHIKPLFYNQPAYEGMLNYFLTSLEPHLQNIVQYCITDNLPRLSPQLTISAFDGCVATLNLFLKMPEVVEYNAARENNGALNAAAQNGQVNILNRLLGKIHAFNESDRTYEFPNIIKNMSLTSVTPFMEKFDKLNVQIQTRLLTKGTEGAYEFPAIQEYIVNHLTQLNDGLINAIKARNMPLVKSYLMMPEVIKYNLGNKEGDGNNSAYQIASELNYDEIGTLLLQNKEIVEHIKANPPQSLALVVYQAPTPTGIFAAFAAVTQAARTASNYVRGNSPSNEYVPSGTNPRKRKKQIEG